MSKNIGLKDVFRPDVAIDRSSGDRMCTIKALIATTLIFIGALLLGVSETRAESPHGDWVVDGVEVVENETILLNGDLIVESEGSLTLRNVTLKLSCQYDGQHRISVKPGGSLSIYDGSISATEGGNRFTFMVAGDHFLMKDSEIHGCGWGRWAADESGIPEPAPWNWSVAGLFVDTDNAVITNNLISNNFAAIIVQGTEISVTNNIMISNDYNPIVVNGPANHITNNLIKHSVASGWARCIDVYGDNNIVANNTLSTEPRKDRVACVSGISVTSWGNKIANNTMLSLNGYGISLGVRCVSCNNIVENNKMSVGEFGIHVEGSNNRIATNRIVGAETGIDLVYSYNNVVANNSLSKIGGIHGVRMCHSSDNAIVNNRISLADSIYFSSGIFMWRSSKKNKIQGNTILASHQSAGIFVLYSSGDNTINDNTISSAHAGPIILDDSSGNLIYGNNFIDVLEPPYDDGYNRWDHEGEGNYWSDYTGEDLNQDGVGDKPYNIKPNGIDNHPLMKAAVTEPAPVPDVEPIPPKAHPECITITEDQFWEDETIVLDTHLNINSGAKLPIRNPSLIMLRESHSAFITVNGGGSLYIYHSVITDTESGHGCRFVAQRDSKFVMRDSEWHGVYYAWWNEGFEIYTDNATIADNTITGVSIMLVHTSFVRVANNTILNSLSPLILFGSTNTVIENNKISRSFEGAICLQGPYGGGEGGSDNNIITGNHISDTWKWGIMVEGDNNLIHHNNFMNCSWSARDSGTGNRWDYGGEGNYWSLYDGEDKDGDGIGDTPYRIPPNGVDRYPLLVQISAELRQITLSFTTSDGTPLDNATVRIEYPDGKEKTFTTNTEGNILLARTPSGRYRIKEVTWHGTLLNIQPTNILVDESVRYHFIIAPPTTETTTQRITSTITDTATRTTTTAATFMVTETLATTVTRTATTTAQEDVTTHVWLSAGLLVLVLVLLGTILYIRQKR